MPKDNLHFRADGTKVMHRDLHNAYGALMARTTYEGVVQRNKEQNLRQFVLTRSFFVGTQKYSQMWTGDNQAMEEFMALSVPQCLSMGIGGQPYCGPDVPGFTLHPEAELYKKWF